VAAGAGGGPETDDGSFGALLRRHRRAAGLTQEALAARAGLSARGVQDLERGVRRTPQRQTVRLLARGLGLAPEAAAALAAAAPRGHRAGGPGAAPGSPVPERGQLPRPLTSFVGRERELAALGERLRDPGVRLVTLTGAGGCGKTRLALRVAADLLDAADAPYPDGAWLVDLAPLADPALVPPAVVAALGVRERPGRPPLATLAEYLRSRHLLLLLDNCEHLLEASARLADALLRACPHVTVLATSREALGLAGETPWRVPSLAVPEARRGRAPEALAQYEAVQLFVQRAVTVQPDFALTDRTAAAVAQICIRLDGLPLALELAAARVRALPVGQLLERLEDRFRLLTGGSRTAPARHQTLRAAVAWSYALLAAPEQRLFARLSVVAGGCTLDAAEAVGAGAGIEADDVLDLLTGLVDKSLVLAAEAPDGTARYRLLETLRQYARERLAAGTEAPAAHDRHLAHFLALAERAEPALRGPDAPAWIDRLEAEHDNLRAALAWALRAGAEGPGAPRAAPGLRLAGALWFFWFLRAHREEGRDWLERLLARAAGAPVPPAVRAKALLGAGFLGGAPGQRQARLAEAVALYRQAGDPRGASYACCAQGYLAATAGDRSRGAALLEESLGLARAAASPWHEAWALIHLANVANQGGDAARALALAERGLALARPGGDLLQTAGAYRWLGDAAFRLGDLDRAAAAYAEDLTRTRALRDPFGVVIGLKNLSAAVRARGDVERAAALGAESLALCREHGLGEWALPMALASLGFAVLRQGEHHRAAALFAEALALRRASGSAGAIVQCLVGLAGAAAGRGRTAPAARLLGAAERLAAEGARLNAPEQADVDRALTAARARLADPAFAAAWTAGQAMTLEQAIADALRASPAVD
jgi:non-specific serine/threonine protein kinase